MIQSDIERWTKQFELKYNHTTGLLYLLSFYPEFRNLFYFRVGHWKYLLNIICPGIPSLYIETKHIGKGFFIQHGFSTIIAAKSIGDYCWVNQQVTIGYANKTDLPVLNDNVTVHAGAKIIGGVIIGSNSIVGANAVVIKDVPVHCTVVGVPARIIKRNGIRVTV